MIILWNKVLWEYKSGENGEKLFMIIHESQLPASHSSENNLGHSKMNSIANQSFSKKDFGKEKRHRSRNFF